MKALIQHSTEMFMRPVFLILFLPVLWVTLFFLTESFIGSVLLYVWMSVLFISFALLNAEELKDDWHVLAYLHTLFFASLFQVLLYLSLIL
jgi:hypothetical protein